jgi:hypothetical protein
VSSQRVGLQEPGLGCNRTIMSTGSLQQLCSKNCSAFFGMPYISKSERCAYAFPVCGAI